MKRALIILCVLFLACDRADELLASAVLEALAEPAVPHSDHAADCARGEARMLSPDVQATVDCRHIDAGRRAR